MGAYLFYFKSLDVKKTDYGIDVILEDIGKYNLCHKNAYKLSCIFGNHNIQIPYIDTVYLDDHTSQPIPTKSDLESKTYRSIYNGIYL